MSWYRASLFTAGLLTTTAAFAGPPKAVGGQIGQIGSVSGGKSSKNDVKKETKEEKKAKALARQLAIAEFALINEQDPKAAAAEFKKAQQMDPGNVKIAIQLAEVQVQLADFKSAIAQLEKQTKKNATNASLWHAIGAVKLKSGDEKGGMEALKKAVEIEPGDAEALFALFRYEYQKVQAGDATVKPDAIARARQFLRASSMRRGLAYQAVERALMELAASPNDLAIYDAKHAYEQAFAETRIGRINDVMGEARRGFERCIATDPDNQVCHAYLGMIFASVKSSDHYDTKKAVEELSKAKDIADAQVELGALLRRMDEPAAATRALNRALELDSSHGRAMLELGILAKLEGKTDEAVDLFAKAYRSDPMSSTGSRALDELTKLRPDHELARLGLMSGPRTTDIFASERFLAAVSLIEQRFGGVEENAPETAAVREIVARLVKAAEQTPSKMPRVAVLSTPRIVNAMALPNGNVYVTRALLETFKKTWPDKPIDANNSALAFVLAHELAHVTKQHSVQSNLFIEATRDADARIDPAVITHTTRLQEIEADRVGMITAFLAGYGPRGGLEFLATEGKEMEIPAHLDHPTFDERVHYLEEYWSNDVKYAFQAFKSGVGKIDKGGELEATDQGQALALYKDALEDFRRFRETVTAGPEVLNNMGVAYARVGVLAQARGGSALNNWLTPLSVERQVGLKYKSLSESANRGAGDEVPWQLTQAIGLFKEALGKNPGYRRASINLAVADIAIGTPAAALEVLTKLPAATGADGAEAQNLVGVAQASSGKNGDAEVAFKSALTQQPGQQAAMFNLGRLYKNVGRKPDSDGAWKSCLAKYPAGPWADVAKKEMAAVAPAAVPAK